MKAGFAPGALGLLACVALGAVAGAHGFRLDGAVIQNSGSTNFPGYTLRVWSDGSAIPNKTGNLPKDLVARFFADVRRARGVRAQGEPCMKSASFGSTTTVLWHRWTSPDLECAGAGDVRALANDVHQIVNALGIAEAPRRIPMLPNEPRRLPDQASPSPEPGRPVS